MAKSAAPFVLTPSDHATLQGWSRMGSLAQRLGQRAKILLLADGLTPKDVSHQPSAPDLGTGGVPMAKALSGSGS
jgi:hypothetical protein